MPRNSLTKVCCLSIGVVFFAMACGRGSESVRNDELLEATESATFENVTRLGPHRFKATLERERVETGHKTVEQVDVAWADWDNFQLQRYRNDKLRAETRVIRGNAYARSGSGRFREAKDAELYRVEMRHSASFWGRAMEPFLGRVEATAEESALLNGRPAQRYSFSLTVGEAPERGHHPLSLQGEMWIDEATATRLSASLEGHYLKNGKAGDDVLLSLQMDRSDIGIIPPIERPSGARRSRF